MLEQKTSFETFLSEQDIVIMPGGTGTELQRRGYKTKLPLWSATANEDAFDLVTDIHRDYFHAGADICVTNTFRTTPRAYQKVNRPEKEARDALKRAVDAAREAQKSVKDRPTFVAGSFTTLEDCYSPDLVPSDQELEEEHDRQAAWLAAEKVDYLLAETINALTEGQYMARAASKTGMPFIITFVADTDGNLLDGNSLSDAIKSTDLPGRIAVGLNCRPMDVIDRAFSILTDQYDGTKIIYPNGFGHPHDDLGWLFEENSDSLEKFVGQASHWHEKGAKIIGGCCGTTPAYIDALSNKFRT